jgi:CheY-like chemotaxis protein
VSAQPASSEAILPRRSRKTQIRSAPGTTARRRVLIVEGDADNRDSLGALFETRGHEVDLASTGAQAVAIAALRHPDIVLVDLGLPDMDGEQAVTAMKRGPSAPFVVAYTGYQRREAQARAAGCDAFVLKPSLDLLIAMVEALDPRTAREAG